MAKILLIDDDDELHTLYNLYLQGESHELLEAFNGQEGFEILERETPDMIILDMIMPVKDGETFLREAIENGKCGEIPIVIASVNDKIPAELLEFKNVQTVMKKPFAVDTLLETIQKIVS